MFQKPKGFTQNCIVLFDGEGPHPLIMWMGGPGSSIYRVTQQWWTAGKVTEERTLHLLKEELKQLLQAAENYEKQGAQGEN